MEERKLNLLFQNSLSHSNPFHTHRKAERGENIVVLDSLESQSSRNYMHPPTFAVLVIRTSPPGTSGDYSSIASC